MLLGLTTGLIKKIQLRIFSEEEVAKNFEVDVEELGEKTGEIRMDLQ